MRQALRGDCHTHTDWSDGGDTLHDMVVAAAQAGHDYFAITDHSPRLRIANGLSAQRLRKQIDEIAAVNQSLAETGFRVLTGIEVDILPDGSLDQDPNLLADVDIVVGSVHSELRMDKAAMTRRMTRALANPHLDILGHCTGRKLPVVTDEAHASSRRRPPSSFDANAVFAAAARYDKAIEINSRPDRLDPPSNLLRKAAAIDGLRFAIDSDAHAAAQLEWLKHGCERAEAAGIAPERVVNTWRLDALLEWTKSHEI
ncbi:PHP domain-containing protein [Allorhizocola rhizosphaerae]|uniref:PHP domain-containing protein n=1 Tax=Allorhizocola rhizosphaerae TaxID=1872709 RepID=UPI001FECB734|nr:PHP domain-containing protein [Allorhizocola rhizosphaerae]